MNEASLRDAICEAGRRLYARGLVASTEGNISARLEPGRYLCTPSGVSKGFMQPGDILIVDGEGKRLEGTGRVSTEVFTHLACYEEREDVDAVVHAHPPTAVALTLARVDLLRPVLPELVMSLEGIPTTAYSTPGTHEGAQVLRPFIRKFDAVLLDRHGAVTVGNSVESALFKMENVEHAATIILRAKQLGRVPLLEEEQLTKLAAARADYLSGSS